MAYQVNKMGRAVRADFSAATVCAPPSGDSAIDEFLKARADVVARSATRDDTDRGILLLWMVSASEMYFRRVFAELSGLCPVAKEKLSSQVAVVGALDYYGQPAAALAVLDAGSLSDPDSIRKRSQGLLAIEINSKRAPALDVALAEYDSVCQVRHALVHAYGRLGYGNIQTLGLKANSPCILRLDNVTFQTCVAVVENLVRAYNQHAFSTIVDRWIANRILSGEWSSQDKAILEPLYRACRCDQDGMAASCYRLYQKDIQPVVRKRNATG